jgi:hypothetical protein
MAYIRAVQSGNYSDTATWDGGVVPTTGDVACVGTTQRITLDIDPLAELSTTSADHITSGGTDAYGSGWLTTGVTSGFTVPDGATRTILKYRYDQCRTTTVNATTAPLTITNGTITINEVVLVGVVSVFTTKTILISATNVLNLTVGTVTITPLHNTSSSWSVFELNKATSANITLVFGDIIPASGTSIGCPLIRDTATICTSISVTFTGQIYSRTVNGHTIELAAVTSGLPIGISSFTALSDQIGAGTGTGGCISIRHFKVVEFTDLSLLKDSLNSTNQIIQATDILTSVLIDSDVTLPALGSLSFSGAASVTINGNISRVATDTTSPSGGISFSGVTGTVTINGDIISDGTLLPGNATAPIVSISGTSAPSTFTVNNLTVIGRGRPCINISSGQMGGLNILGDVDVSAAILNSASSTGFGAAIVLTASAYPSITVAGDVRAADSPSSTSVASNTGSTFCGAIIIASTNGVSSLTVNGAVYAGRSTPAIVTNSTTDFPIKVTKVVSGSKLLSTTLAPPAIQTVIQTVEVDELDFGPEGRYPIHGYVKFRTAATGIVRALNMDGSPCVLAEQGDGLVTLAANVRSGVTIGETTGTLVVPDAEDVRSGTIYDNGTVGTLDSGGTPVHPDIVSITAQLDELEGFVDDILGVTDALNITTAVQGKKLIVGG